MYDWNKILSVLQKEGFSESVRAEELSYEVFVELFLEVF